MKRYKAAVQDERQIAPLSDDYVKFIRFAHERVQNCERAIVGMITNHAYLLGLIHRGMREELMKSFLRIYVLDLHGSRLHGLVTPLGSKDENVFDIQQGVAIVFLVRKADEDDRCQVRHADLWGLRERKYEWLLHNSVSSTAWQNLIPDRPFFFFAPKDFTFRKEYERGSLLSLAIPTLTMAH